MQQVPYRDHISWLVLKVGTNARGDTMITSRWRVIVILPFSGLPLNITHPERGVCVHISKAITISRCPMAELVTASDCYTIHRSTSEGPEFEPLWDSFFPHRIRSRVRASLGQVIVLHYFGNILEYLIYSFHLIIYFTMLKVQHSHYPKITLEGTCWSEIWYIHAKQIQNQLTSQPNNTQI